ncbi:MAG: DUF2577 domain-containing protein [Bacteroidales bacterium]|nr:DUF2577 domain-containing protein [Bacteroidales bacterium]
MSGTGTSLKELFQGMIPSSCSLLQGTVISVSPLKIQIANDAKLVISAASTIIPKHLTDRTVKVTIPNSGGHSQYVGSGIHSHTEVNMTIYDGLKPGDKLHLLAVQNSKKFIALGRVAG